MPVYGNLTTNLPTTTGAAGGPSTILVKVLQEYDRQLPLDFVAMILGRTRPEIEDEVEGLERQGVAKRLGHDEVTLVR
jgi:hypothetical protein